MSTVFWRRRGKGGNESNHRLCNAQLNKGGAEQIALLAGSELERRSVSTVPIRFAGGNRSASTSTFMGTALVGREDELWNQDEA